MPETAITDSGPPTSILWNKKGKYPRLSRKHGALGRLVGNGSTIIAFLTAFLFVCGWIYLSEYYDSFGIDILSLDLPIYASLVASINALLPMLGKFVPLLYVGIIIAIVAVLMRYLLELFWFRAFLAKLLLRIKRTFLATPTGLRPMTFILPTWVTFVEISVANVSVGLAVLSLALAFCVWAGKLADKDAEFAYRQPRIKTVLTFKTEGRQLLSGELLQINGHGGLRLLTQTKDLVVVFVKRELQPGKRGAFVIPTASLVAVHNELLNVNSQRAEKRDPNKAGLH